MLTVLQKVKQIITKKVIIAKKKKKKKKFQFQSLKATKGKRPTNTNPPKFRHLKAYRVESRNVKDFKKKK